MPDLPEETEELDITEIVERIEKLEKENLKIKEENKTRDNRITDCEDSIDAIAGKLRG